MENTPLNPHHKKEYPPMHTAEHLLNQTMVRMFGCERSKNSHIERKKSKCDYILSNPPTTEQISEIERTINTQIERQLSVTSQLLSRHNIPENIDLSKLPEDASHTLRLVAIGDYDLCACIGDHVSNTSEMGQFKIISSDFENGRWRVRFKLVD